MAVTPEELAHWQSWTGRQETREQVLDAEALRRFAATIGESLDVEAVQPSLAHWAFFLPTVAADEIGPDGHPRRGGFLPPITLARRMFAASSMRFDGALALGEAALLTQTIASVKHKSGKSGDLVFVEVDRTIAQHGVTRVQERQSIVYRAAGERTMPVVDADLTVEAGEVTWHPTPVDLFRFSAVTFNSHRIHYDLPYTMQEEGYPALVIHGPFTAVRLFGFARHRAGRPPAGFEFRAAAPLFLGQGVRLAPDAAPGGVRAIRCDGTVAMNATARF
ncbi:MaoC family dehydratase N-terminal domain-containing protein [Niveispirillum sp.]|uniref:FAS1-like dehydratase domain-containing protein n=1 Tax=Niveispirillum sp. TaxID=1917217 RepID=UPI001B493AE2|nr:MaoC family dehydratase N-terminal domain-containing protein [Niveispirillum sp.]MBP7336286.1 MaoC family dehydratase N-terminal domain-containing protein [Niveispirillum sp.]